LPLRLIADVDPVPDHKALFKVTELPFALFYRNQYHPEITDHGLGRWRSFEFDAILLNRKKEEDRLRWMGRLPSRRFVKVQTPVKICRASAQGTILPPITLNTRFAFAQQW